MTLEERIIKLEVLLERSEEDIKSLHEIVKTHMEREESERKLLIEKLQAIEESRLGDRKFIGGIVFTISSLWAIGIAIYELVIKHT